MGFNPLDEKGLPLDQQILEWDEANIEPFDRRDVHPYTRTRVILMNGIEVEGVLFKHQMARHCDNMDVRRQLAITRRVEQQQQKMVNWLIPGTQTNLEVTLGFEQVAVDLTAWLAKTEPSAHVKAALDFALLEDFDHLYRYSNLYMMDENRDPAEIIGDDLTEVFPGRPTAAEHRHPIDTVFEPAPADADLLSKLHILTIVAAEQQTMNLYMNIGNRPVDMLGRGLYLEIAQVEEEHVTQYESLIPPTASWFERALLHEYNECWLYYACMQSEPDERIRRWWQFHLDCEIAHLHGAVDLMRKFGDKDPMAILPSELPEPLMIFQSNKEYVRDVLAEQESWTINREKIVEADDKPGTFDQYQSWVNVGAIPSEEVIAVNPREYRLEVLGPVAHA
ncbi:MAG: hypothetical protein GX591_02825 [Planctomycetes bacterium]|nr:hypothetical protein [Planctomycetota bacterium]